MVLTGHTRDRVMSSKLNSESDPGQPLGLSDQNQGPSEGEESMSAEKMMGCSQSLRKISKARIG
jgi:hypothetical protein